MKRKVLIPILVIVLIGSVIAAVILSQPQREDALVASVQITPTAETEKGIEADTAFTLTTDYSVSEARLREMLVVEPAIEYTLSGSQKSWTLTPAEPLQDNMVYTIQIKSPNGTLSQSFAFQTRSDLLVNSAYPYHEAEYVNINTGIEFVFNSPDVDVKDYFTILPEVPGRFESSGYTATFIPDEPLQPNSIYRVTLKQGLAAPSGMTLQKDYSISFTTDEEWDGKRDYQRLRLTGRFSETFLPGDTLAVEMQCYEDVEGLDFDIAIHQFENIDAYIKTLEERDTYYQERYGQKQDYTVQTEGLAEIASYTAPLFLKGEHYWDNLYAILPETLGEGYYVVTISGQTGDGSDEFVQKMIQIVNMSAYVQSTDGDTLVWLNDPKSGKPLSGAEIELREIAEEPEAVNATTQADGTARVMTGEMAEAALRVKSGGQVLYYERFLLSGQKKAGLDEKYYAAVYTDREIYQPTDTVRFWGVVRPRTAADPMPKTVFANLGNYNMGESAYRVELPVAADGSFSGEISFSGLAKSYYSFSVTNGVKPDPNDYSGQNVYLSKGFSIGEYTKPPYVITVKPDKDYYELGETATLNISASYFDGTPVAGGELLLSAYQWTGENEMLLKLDEEGKASATAPITKEGVFDGYGADDVPGWEPTSIWYSIRSDGQEDVQIWTSGEFTVLPSRVAVELEAEAESSLTIRTAQFNKENVNWDEETYYNYENSYERFAGAAVDVPVTVVVHKLEYQKELVGTYYDYINKKNVQRYVYRRNQTVADTIQTKTTNGTVTLENLPYQDEQDVYYWYEARVDGGLGTTVQSTQHILHFGGGEEDVGRYTFVAPQSRYSYYNESQMKLGEKVELGLYNNGTQIENKGTVLYSVSKRKMVEVGQFTGATESLTMNEEYLPNVIIAGAYFDGRHVYAVDPYRISYNTEERALNIEITPQQEAYKPGDTAKVTLKITDPQGKPTAATAAIGVVDESIFAIAEQEVNLLSQFYHTLYYSEIMQNVSYKEYALEDAAAMTGGGGGGGGGGDILRSDFLDTAWFQTVQVDASGVAEVEFTLPDNVTSWRVTAAAVTEENELGDACSNTVVTLPFFIQPVVTDTYLVGDDITFTASGVGTEATLGEKINFTVMILNNKGGEIDRLEREGTVGQKVSFNFGKYDEGQYSAQIIADCADNRDAVKVDFAVGKQGLTLPIYKNMPLSEIGSISPVRYPVQIIVYDEDMKPFMDGIEYLSSRSGDRTEITAASWKARQIYNELLDEDARSPLTRDIGLDDLTADDGGIRLLPLSEGDADVTAKLLLAAPDLVQPDMARNFLQGVLHDASATPQARAMAYAGLAAVKDPVLLDVKRQLQLNTALTPAEKLYLGSGLAALGDFEGAKAVYDQFCDQIVTEGAIKYLEMNGTSEERLQNTAAALMLTSLIKHEDADAYMRYFTGLNDDARSYQDTVLYDLEMLTYLTNYDMPTGKKAAAFSYTELLNKKQTEVKLDDTKFWSADFFFEAFENANFKVTKGNVYANVRYDGYAAEITAEQSPLINITKRYIPVGSDEITVGGRVKVELVVQFDRNAPAGRYEISDYIPSGMRYMPDGGYDGEVRNAWGWSTIAQEGQQVHGYIYRRSPAPLFDEIVTKDMDYDQAMNALIEAGYDWSTAEKALAGWGQDSSVNVSEMNEPAVMGLTPDAEEPIAEEPIAEEPIAEEPVDLMEEPFTDPNASVSSAASKAALSAEVSVKEIPNTDSEDEVEVAIDDEPYDPNAPAEYNIPSTSGPQQSPFQKAAGIMFGDLNRIMSTPESDTYVITYYISATMPGDYVVESAYVTPYEEGIFARTPRGKIQIKD